MSDRDNRRPVLVVTGARECTPYQSREVRRRVSRAGWADGAICYVGDAHGVDAAIYAVASDRAVNVFAADWDIYGNAAGPRRNAEMVAAAVEARRAGARVMGIAFPDAKSRGTWDCVRKLAAAGLEVHVVPLESL